MQFTALGDAGCGGHDGRRAGTGLVLGMCVCHPHATVHCTATAPIVEKKTLRHGF